MKLAEVELAEAGSGNLGIRTEGFLIGEMEFGNLITDKGLVVNFN